MKALAFSLFLLSFSVFAVGTPSCDKGCTFVLMEDSGDIKTIVNVNRARQPFTPYSTFKIPNTLIALDVGVVRDMEHILSFDKEQYPVQSWWPQIWYKESLTIRPAFQNSAVPIYQEIANKIGEVRMQEYLNGFEYGNRDISSGLDTFWLNGSVQISALQQVQFLKRLFDGELPISDATLETFKQVMRKEQTEDYTLYAKTGGGGIAKEKAIGWYVGMVEKKDKSWYFAINIDGKSFSEVQKTRIEVANSILRETGVL
ncbi:penicillin-binding transpeptidase domain-containing protein [Planctobacterium marinum]|uniref:Beta-lactamase n=1 Tax=Planctobacterium marinum TaxID=1631968 RepID=A0AA48KQY6_9ALTE|nr:hypothetical protein MACH26_24840 [Planctobacterium marinum]